MTAALRRAASSLFVLPALVLALGVTGCGPTANTSPKSVGTSANPSPRLTAVPGGAASPGSGAAATLPSTTQTDFGLIFDSLPASFPKLPGQEPAETGEGPASGSFAVNMDARAASQAMRAALVAAGWTADVGAPLEDGTVVLEAARSSTCKAEVRFTPRSGTVIMSVLYGSKCPFA